MATQDKMIRIKNIKKELRDHVGDVVQINYNLGRNKYETYHVIIKELYSNVFLVEQVTDYKMIKSFSYADIITNTIKIHY